MYSSHWVYHPVWQNLHQRQSPEYPSASVYPELWQGAGTILPELPQESIGCSSWRIGHRRWTVWCCLRIEKKVKSWSYSQINLLNNRIEPINLGCSKRKIFFPRCTVVQTPKLKFRDHVKISWRNELCHFLRCFP